MHVPMYSEKTKAHRGQHHGTMRKSGVLYASSRASVLYPCTCLLYVGFAYAIKCLSSKICPYSPLCCGGI